MLEKERRIERPRSDDLFPELAGGFASLHPGYFVVWSGVYDTLEEAQTAATRALARFPNAYAREIAR